MNTLLKTMAFFLVILAPSVVWAGANQSYDEYAAEKCAEQGLSPDECMLTRPDDPTEGEETVKPASASNERVFYQAPPDEAQTGSANAAMRDKIRNAQGYRTYQLGPLRTQDGPPEPFGSYSSTSDATTDGTSSNSGVGRGVSAAAASRPDNDRDDTPSSNQECR